MIRFSIIIPVYNVEEYLNYCIHSVLKQQYGNFEVLLVNDGSADRSGMLCDQWATKDTRIKVIHKINGGASSARNAGLDLVTGQYILFLDGDDYWLSEQVLSRISERIEQTTPDVLIYNLRKDFDGVLSKSYFSDELTMPVMMSDSESQDYVFSNHLWTACAWNKAVKASIFNDDSMRFREGVTSEDVEWCYQLAVSANRFDFVNMNVVGYRQRSASITGSTNIYKIQCLIDNIKKCLERSDSILPEKRNHLKSYVGYQFATLLHGYSLLQDSPEKHALLPEIKLMRRLLDWSSDAKVVLIKQSWKILGLKLTLNLLAIRANIQTQHKKRGE